MIFKLFRALGGALLVALATSGIADPAAAAQSESATVTYRLPMQGPLPRTYRVTLAITADDDPNWIISTFVSGAVRTVTAENKGEFTESWNGLDDNFMPVPPGRYGVKGIYMPAQKWEVTGEFHSLIPKLAVAAGDSWFPTRRDDLKTPWTNTAGFGTMTDIAIGKNGEAVFLHSYLENALNPYVVDLNRPIGDGQILRAYRSGGTAGGEAVATDGELVWAVSPQGRGGSDFIYRPDEKPFGHDRSMYRDNVFVVPGKVTSLAAWRDPQTGARFLYVAERNTPSGLLILDGNTGDMLEEMPVTDAQAVTTDGSALFVLHRVEGGKWVVDRLSLRNGRPAGRWGRWLILASIAHPADVKVDHQGRTFVSDASANQVYEFDRNGRLLRHFGRAAVQRAGHYDPQVFMSPNKLALWTDRRGEERLLVVERAGPGRISEWSPGGKLLRQWFPGQVGAVFGYAIDPEDPRHVYMPSSAGSGVIRFHVDYGTGAWAVDAVWPDIAKSNGCPGGLSFPKIVNTHGHKYLTFARTHEADEPCGYMIYRLDGDRFVAAAGLVRPAPVVEHVEPSDFLWWNDANGDGKIDPSEYRGRPGKLPTRMNYWGDHWLDDLSLVTLENGGREAWRIAPSGFDRHGNPIFDGARWKQILVDPIIAGLTAGQVDPRRGGNELLPGSDNSWMDAEGTTQSGFFVAASTGPPWPDGLDSAGRIASQVKLSRYVPDGSGGYRLLWRVGRKAPSILQTGEMYSALHVSAAPIDGMVTVQDGNGLVHVFTDGGLYVDTLLVDAYRGEANKGGVYGLSGELFDGYAFLNREDGKVYIAMGRDAATIYEVKGWTKSSRIAFPITALRREIILTAGATAPAPEFALRVRAGQPAARIAVLEPATGGGPSLDGSLDGWSRATPLSFGLDDEHRVEIQALYDPDTLYLRAHLRLPRAPQAAPADVAERIFTDSIGADTFSFYIQGDPLAQGSDANGRSGDARFVFGLVRSGQGVQPVVVGMYPERHGGGGPEHRVSYDSPVGHVEFADVAIVRDARLGYRIDDDERGFVIAAALPRRAIPAAASFGSSGFLHTTLDFEATLGGKTKFWWSNLDRAASTITSDVPSEARFYPGAWGSAQFVPLDGALSAGTWLVSGPWGGPGRAAIEALASGATPGPWKSAIQQFYEAAHYPPDAAASGFDSIYEGPLSLDASGSSRSIAWRLRRSEEELGDVRLDSPGALYYAAQWIWSPDDRQVVAEFLYERQNFMKAWLNGTPLTDAPYLPARNSSDLVPGWMHTVPLHAGWNRLLLRGFAVGYELKIGLRLHDDPIRLWQLGLEATPPAQSYVAPADANHTTSP